MAKIKAIELTEEQRTALEKGWRHGPSHAFRQRCQMILLKAQWRVRAKFMMKSHEGAF